jgi:endonuclease YncB( thermonuclease family)
MTVWNVPARVTRVIDGDTVVADLDLGWSTWRLGQRVRLLGCDAPEMNTAEGKAARGFVQQILWDAYGVDREGVLGMFYPIRIASHSIDNFGRVLAYVGWTDRSNTVHDLTKMLLDAGHAVPRGE